MKPLLPAASGYGHHSPVPRFLTRPAVRPRSNRCCGDRLLSLAFAVAGLSASVAYAAVITTEWTDLADPVAGEDLWRASYAVSDVSFSTGQGFTLYFAHDQYRDLASVTPPDHPGWDLLVVQPDLGLPDAGFFDGLALVDSPSLAAPFGVTFVWFGGPNGPGQQPFELYDTSGGFSVIGGGTTSPIPEPATGVLFLGGTCLAAAILRRFHLRYQARSQPGSARRQADGRPRASKAL